MRSLYEYMAAQKDPDLPHKDSTLSVRVTAKQAQLIEQRAKRCGVPTRVWMRTILLQAAQRQPSEGFLRIKEPDGSIL